MEEHFESIILEYWNAKESLPFPSFLSLMYHSTLGLSTAEDGSYGSLASCCFSFHNFLALSMSLRSYQFLSKQFPSSNVKRTYVSVQ